MSEFFKSEQVRNDIFEMENLQRDLAKKNGITAIS